MTIKKQPQIRFGGFGGDWVEKKIIELAYNQKLSNGVFNNPENVGSGYKLINVLDMYSEGFIQENKLSLLELSKVEFENNQVKNGDIFFTRSSLVKTGIAFSNIYLGNSDDVTFDGHLIKLSPDLDRYYSEFLHFSLKNQKVREQFIRSAKTTTMTTIGQAEIANTVVSLPEKPEQIAIGQFFRQLDEMLTLAEQKHAQTVQLKKALLGKLFPISGSLQPQIRSKGFSGDWVERKLGDFGDSFASLSGKTKEDFGHGEARYITYLNVYQNPIASPLMLDKIEIDPKQNAIQKGDILFTVSSETPEEVGFSSVWTEDLPNVYLNSFCFGFRPTENFDSYFIAYALRSTFVRQQIILLAQGISRYNISKKGVMNVKIRLPETLAEQTAIGKLFQTLDHTIALQAKEITQIKQLKSALLGKMFV